ncbi:hypothetical protein GOP47_0005829 [Adiantum capillus-veneris]|uniref:DUF4408 domain-containing protein n=1 Tax=Adiantum capillus-veneris TaxID=13818 RepID=A0A9D4ZPH2_ADICA|nr:hypothetical protein GOP47_0005829 [Adiantum capillus-veneris]
MAASSPASKHQQLIMRLYPGGLSLPALSFLALVTGFTFSLTLPSSLQALVPAMESLFFVSLPHLWRASLSWITPPCLFVLLNGIIMILTATSARSSSSSSSSDAGSSALMEPNLPTQIENVPFKQSAANLVHALTETYGTMSATATILDDTLQIGVPLDMQIPLAHSLHAEKVELTEAPSLHDDYGDVKEKKLVLCINHEDASAVISIAKIDREHDATCIDDPSSSSLAICQEIVRAGSEPSSPHFPSSHAHAKSNIRRSMSIDSVSYIDEGEGAASEQLSEEAFKKRIDDFILKMNSKIRSETRVSYMG